MQDVYSKNKKNQQKNNLKWCNEAEKLKQTKFPYDRSIWKGV